MSLILFTLEIPILAPVIKHPIILFKQDETRDTRSGPVNIWTESVFGVECLNELPFCSAGWGLTFDFDPGGL